MTDEQLLVEQSGPVAVVTINRPKVLNALNAALISQLHDQFLALLGDASVRTVILTGSGERAFVAGADISELATLSPAAAREVALRGQALCDCIQRSSKVCVAAINGVALGGGLELAMACTLRVAADTAKLGQPEINLGLIPGFGGTQRLPRLIGRGPALEMLLTGRPIEAAEAHRLGLVNRVVPAADVLAEAKALATALAAQPPLAVAHILDVVGSGLQMSLRDGCGVEATAFGLVAATEDMHEGTRAFLEKRKPEFTGR